MVKEAFDDDGSNYTTLTSTEEINSIYIIYCTQRLIDPATM